MSRNPLINHIGTCLLALVVAASVAPLAVASPVLTSSESAPGGRPFVTVDKRAVSVPVNGTFGVTVSVEIDKPTGYLESRLQLRNPGGRLIYQKTEVRNEVATGTASLAYSRELGDLDLDPGVYPLEIRVRSDAAG